MNEYLVILAGSQQTVNANSRDDAINKLDEADRPWVLDVVEVE